VTDPTVEQDHLRDREIDRGLEVANRVGHTVGLVRDRLAALTEEGSGRRQGPEDGQAPQQASRQFHGRSHIDVQEEELHH